MVSQRCIVFFKLLQSFTFHHEEDHKGGCRLDFIVLSRDKEPEMDGRNFWNVEEVFTDLIVGKNSTNSGAMQVALEPGSFYSTAVHADNCTGRDGLYYPVQANRDGPTDVGVGETIGYVRGEKQVEADGSVSGIQFNPEYTSPYRTTLHISEL